MSYFLEHKRGLLGTILFHLVLLLILIFFGFITPLPLPQEEGILINFGTEEMGGGLIEPSETTAPTKKEEKEPSPATPPVAKPQPAKEEIMTQDIEETVAIPSKKEKVKPPEPDLKALEEERKKQEELERIKQEELEKKRQEEIERKKREEEQKRIDEIQNRTRNAFSSGKSSSDNKSTSEGITSGTGNQGGINGSTESKNRSGKGYGNEGISYSLSGRTPQALPLPEYNYQVEGIVVVEVTVDRNGKVTKATPGVKGSTTLDENLLRAARKAAIAASFDKNPDAPAFQKGTITYHFDLQ